MRKGVCRKVAGLSAALLAWAGLGEARGQQQPFYGQPAPQGAVQVGCYDQSSAREEELHELRARLDRYEAELNALRAQGQPQFAVGQNEVNSRLTALEMQAGEKKDAAPAAKPGEPVKIDLITKPAMNVAGRVYFDHIMYDEGDLDTNNGTDLQDETGFRTIRLGAKGYVYENVYAAIEFEFEGEETDFKDCYIELQELGYYGSTVRAGYFKEPFSLEDQTSDNFTTFMERSLPFTAFVPQRNYGVMAYDYLGFNDDWTWFAGVFRDNSPDAPPDGNSSGTTKDDNGAVCFTFRFAGNPYYDEPNAGRCLTHIGAAYSFRQAPQNEDGPLDTVTLTSRQELGTQAGYLSTGAMDADSWNLFGGELGWQNGPVGAAAEYYAADVEGAYFWGGYVETWYFLTGENRGYKRDYKAWDRVKPYEDFFCVRTADGICKGMGAWQVAARYSYLDLGGPDADSEFEGQQQDLTLGLNWYLNPYTRWMFNYVYNDINRSVAGDGNSNFYGTRFQVDF